MLAIIPHSKLPFLSEDRLPATMMTRPQSSLLTQLSSLAIFCIQFHSTLSTSLVENPVEHNSITEYILHVIAGGPTVVFVAYRISLNKRAGHRGRN